MNPIIALNSGSSSSSSSSSGSSRRVYLEGRDGFRREEEYDGCELEVGDHFQG